MMIKTTTLVDDVMRSKPATIRVFLDFRMMCVGCPIGCFHTVEDACREHGVSMPQFMAALQAAASNDEFNRPPNRAEIPRVQTAGADRG